MYIKIIINLFLFLTVALNSALAQQSVGPVQPTTGLEAQSVIRPCLAYPGNEPRIGEDNLCRGVNFHTLFSDEFATLVQSGLKHPQHADYQVGFGQGVRLLERKMLIVSSLNDIKWIDGFGTEVDFILSGGEYKAVDKRYNDFVITQNNNQYSVKTAGYTEFYSDTGITSPGRGSPKKHYVISSTIFDNKEEINIVRAKDKLSEEQIVFNSPDRTTALQRKTEFKWIEINGAKFLWQVKTTDQRVWMLGYTGQGAQLQLTRVMGPFNDWQQGEPTQGQADIQIVRYEYQSPSEHQIISFTSPEGRKTTYQYAADGGLSYTKDPDNYAERIVANPTTVKYCSSANPYPQQAVTQTYATGKLLGASTVGRSMQVLERNAEGYPTRISQTVQGRQKEFRFSYDSLGRIKSSFDSNTNITEQYVYDPNFNRLDNTTLIAPKKTLLTRYLYEHPNQNKFWYLPTKEIVQISATKNLITEYVYNNNGLLKQVIDPFGVSKGLFDYNTDNQLKTAVDEIGLTEYTYTPQGWPEKITRVIGNERQHVNLSNHLPNGFPKAHAYSGGQSDSLEFNNLWQPKIFRSTAGMIGNMTVRLGMDKDNRLKVRNVFKNGQSNTISAERDPLTGRVVEAKINSTVVQNGPDGPIWGEPQC